MIMRKNEAPIILDRIKDFLAQKKAEGLSSSTLDNYSISLSTFMRECELSESVSVNYLNKDIVQNWVSEMIEAELNSNSIKHRVRDIRVFFYWLIEQGDIPAFKIKLPSLQEQSKPKRYTDEDLSALLVPPDKDQPYWVWRNWLLVNLLLGTGARIGSLCQLRQEDIGDNAITFHKTKNKKELVVPLSATLKQAINKYLRLWSIDSPYLMLTARGDKPLNSHSAIHSFERYAKMRGVSSLGLHAFRHTYATKLYKSGVDIVSLQTLLGHSSIEMTRHYIGKLGIEDLPKFTNPLDELVLKKKVIKRNE